MEIPQNYLDCAIDTNVIIFKDYLEDLIKTVEIYTKKRKWLKPPGNLISVNEEDKKYLKSQGCEFPPTYNNRYLIYWEDEEPGMINCAFGATQ